MFRANMKAFKVEIGKFSHLRQPTTPDNQPVIRMNQDTLYSGALLDLSKPLKLTVPCGFIQQSSCSLAGTLKEDLQLDHAWKLTA